MLNFACINSFNYELLIHNILIFIENKKCYCTVTLNFSVCKQL